MVVVGDSIHGCCLFIAGQHADQKLGYFKPLPFRQSAVEYEVSLIRLI